MAIVWTIWESRNKLIFEGKEPSREEAVDLVRFRIAWWFKHLGRGSTDTVDSLYRNIQDLCVDPKRKKNSRIKDWIPPSRGYYSFNVDGSSKGKPGPAGMGGVLRDFKGKVLCLFSAHLGILDSNVAELWAIKKAVEICISNPILWDKEINVVSDSKVAVSWVNAKDFGNIDHVNFIYEIRSAMEELKGLKVVFGSRVFNSFADSLAKMGSNVRGDFVEWSEF